MTWDEYFMNIARTVAKKSKDPSTQVGCVIVTADNKPVSFGYNGFVAGCDENHMTFERPQKNLLSIHAEMNALIFNNGSIRGCKAYVTHASCENCLKHMLQAGICEVIYEKSNTTAGFITEELKETITRLIKSTGVIYRNMEGKSFLEELEENK